MKRKIKLITSLIILFCTILFISFYDDASLNSCQFRNDDLLVQHYEKHGQEMGYSSPLQYLEGACEVVNNPYSLHKKEKDNDDLYYLEKTNEFVVVSYDGYIRTFYKPNNGLEYFNGK